MDRRPREKDGGLPLGTFTKDRTHPGSPRTIALFGSFIIPNFGDQLLAETVVQWLDQRYRDLRFILPFACPGFCAARPGLEVLQGGGWRTVGACDAAVLVGGGYFGERQHSPRTGKSRFLSALYRIKDLIQTTLLFMKFAGIARILTSKGIPYAVLGPGVGPVTNFLGRWAVRDTLRCAALVVVRDKESREWVERIAPGLRVVTSVDSILGLGPDKVPPMRRYRALGVHWGTIARRYSGPDLLEGFLHSLSDTGLRLYLLSDNHPRGDFDSQFKVYRSLSPGLRRKVTFVPYRDTAQMTRAIRDRYDLVLSTKLHVCIVSYVLGKMPITVAVHAKARRFFRQAALTDNCFDFGKEGLEGAARRIRALMARPSSSGRLLNARRREMKKAALGNRDLLYRFLDPLLQAEVRGGK